MFSQMNYNFVKLGKKATTFALVLFLSAVICIFVKGFRFGLDFTGGVVFDLNITNNDKSLEDKIKSSIVSMYRDSVLQIHENGIIVKIPNNSIKDRKNDIDKVVQLIKSIDEGIVFNKIDFVGPQVGEILVKNGIISIILSFIKLEPNFSLDGSSNCSK